MIGADIFTFKSCCIRGEEEKITSRGFYGTKCVQAIKKGIVVIRFYHLHAKWINSLKSEYPSYFLLRSIQDIAEFKERKQMELEAGLTVRLSVLLLTPANTNKFIGKFFLLILTR